MYLVIKTMDYNIVGKHYYIKKLLSSSSIYPNHLSINIFRSLTKNVCTSYLIKGDTELHILVDGVTRAGGWLAVKKCLQGNVPSWIQCAQEEIWTYQYNYQKWVTQTNKKPSGI